MHTDNYWYHWPGFQENISKKKSVESVQKALKKEPFQWRVSPKGGSTTDTRCGVDKEDKGLLELSSSWVHVHNQSHDKNVFVQLNGRLMKV